MPVMDVCEVDGRQVLVLWAPASDVRPHQAPDGAKGEKKYWVRIGSGSVEAENEILTRNAPWELFASEMDRIRYGLAHYRPHSPAAQLLRYHLAKVHRLEVPDMAYTLDDFKRDTYRMVIDDLHELSAQERQALLERMDVEDRLRGLAAEDRLRGLAAEDRLRGLDPELVKDWLERTGH